MVYTLVYFDGFKGSKVPKKRENAIKIGLKNYFSENILHN